MQLTKDDLIDLKKINPLFKGRTIPVLKLKKVLVFYKIYKNNPRGFCEKEGKDYKKFKDLFSYYGRGWKVEYNDWLLEVYCFGGLL
jgi:hypothetical protein